MDVLQPIIKCLTGNIESAHNKNRTHDFKAAVSNSAEEQTASNIVSVLFSTEKAGHDLDVRIKDMVRTNGLSENLAERILDGIVAALETGAVMGETMKAAFDKAYAAATAFAKEHPVYTTALVTVVAIAILVILLPWVVEALGFGELGPAAGELVCRDIC